jgi:hypothetical protein
MYRIEMLLGKVELEFLQKVRIAIFGSCPVGMIQKKDWDAPAPIYAFKCGTNFKEHGYVTNVPYGHDNNLECPICMKKRLNES